MPPPAACRSPHPPRPPSPTAAARPGARACVNDSASISAAVTWPEPFEPAVHGRRRRRENVNVGGLRRRRAVLVLPVPKPCRGRAGHQHQPDHQRRARAARSPRSCRLTGEGGHHHRVGRRRLAALGHAGRRRRDGRHGRRRQLDLLGHLGRARRRASFSGASSSASAHAGVVRESRSRRDTSGGSATTRSTVGGSAAGLGGPSSKSSSETGTVASPPACRSGTACCDSGEAGGATAAGRRPLGQRRSLRHRRRLAAAPSIAASGTNCAVCALCAVIHSSAGFSPDSPPPALSGSAPPASRLRPPQKSQLVQPRREFVHAVGGQVGAEGLRRPADDARHRLAVQLQGQLIFEVVEAKAGPGARIAHVHARDAVRLDGGRGQVLPEAGAGVTHSRSELTGPLRPRATYSAGPRRDARHPPDEPRLSLSCRHPDGGHRRDVRRLGRLGPVVPVARPRPVRPPPRGAAAPGKRPAPPAAVDGRHADACWGRSARGCARTL